MPAWAAWATGASHPPAWPILLLCPGCLAPAGGGVHDSHVVKGMVLKRGVEGSISSATDAKVAVFAQGVDTASTETKVRWRCCR